MIQWNKFFSNLMFCKNASNPCREALRQLARFLDSFFSDQLLLHFGHESIRVERPFVVRPRIFYRSQLGDVGRVDGHRCNVNLQPVHAQWWFSQAQPLLPGGSCLSQPVSTDTESTDFPHKNFHFCQLRLHALASCSDSSVQGAKRLGTPCSWSSSQLQQYTLRSSIG